MQEKEQGHEETVNHKDSQLPNAGLKEIHSKRKENIIED